MPPKKVMHVDEILTKCKALSLEEKQQLIGELRNQIATELRDRAAALEFELEETRKKLQDL